MAQKAYKFAATINPQGKVELTVPIPPGTVVEVLVLTPDEGDLQELVEASASSTDFWDNPLDDEDWNDA